MKVDDWIKDYRDLRVWQAGIKLTTEIYKLTQDFPKSETFGLTSQMRRAAESIPCNIAEGNGRGTRKDYASFISNAIGSLRELETLIIIAQNVNLLTGTEILKDCEQIRIQLVNFRNSLRQT